MRIVWQISIVFCLGLSMMMAAACSQKAQGNSAGDDKAKSEAKAPTSVQGHTYQNNGGVVVVEFKANGKAYVSAGPTSNTCKYTQSGAKVSLLCEGDKTDFTIDEDDGALLGPPDGMLTRLTLKK